MKRKNKQQSYIISVSLGDICLRHIQLSEHETLEVLSDCILQAFEFEDNHLHAFFLDNQPWSEEESYYSSTGENDKRITSHYQLQQLHMKKGKKIVYILISAVNGCFSVNFWKLSKKKRRTLF